MTFVSIKPSGATVRWYDDPNGYAARQPYRAICSLVYLAEDHVFIYGMHGSLSKEDMRVFFSQLLQEGVTKVTAERKGRLVERDIASLLARADRLPVAP
jgi:hypothetical protein